MRAVRGDHQRNRPISYYLRPSYLADDTQLLTWNDVDDSDIVRYEIGISLDVTELNVEMVDKPRNPILIAFPTSYFTCTGHRSIVIRTNLNQSWMLDVCLRSVNRQRHQDPVVECHLGAMYDADYDGRFRGNRHTDKIANFPHFSVKGVDDEEWSPNFFGDMLSSHWSEFGSIEHMLDGYGRRHYQITRQVDGKVVKAYDKGVSVDRHLPYSSETIQKRISGLSYTQSYECCKSNYHLHGLEDILVHFQSYGEGFVMQTKTRQQLKRVEMSTGDEYAPWFENGYWSL